MELQGRRAVIRGRGHGNRYPTAELQGRYAVTRGLAHRDMLGNGFL